MDQTIKIIEKILLVVIAVATIFATAQEILTLIENRNVQLADLLLLFIYTEVLGMVGVFYKSNKIPITLPLFIAITALSRMIILQGKGSDPQNLIYESAAVLLLAISCLIIRQPSISSLFDKNRNDNDT
jgi:protein PsiE